MQSADDVRLFPEGLVQYSPERRELNLELRDYLYKNLYYNPVVYRAQPARAENARTTFQLLPRPPEGNRRRRAASVIRKIGLHRAVCDYLAGMTDRYVALEYKRIFWTQSGSELALTRFAAPLHNPAEQLGNCFRLPRQNQIRRDFAQRLKHKPPQMRPRMRQDQFRRSRASPSPNAIKSKSSGRGSFRTFFGRRPNSFSSACNFASSDSGVSSFARHQPDDRIHEHSATPADNPPATFATSEDLSIGRSENSAAAPSRPE